MALLNYTTEIAVEKSIMEIQTCLVTHGAQAILCDYDGQGNIMALSFKLVVEGNSVGFRLPSDWRPVLKLLEQNRKVPRRLCTQEQANRVAWRILKDWIEAQMAILETKMVKMEQIFLPYMTVDKEGGTLYEKYASSKFLLN